MKNGHFRFRQATKITVIQAAGTLVRRAKRVVFVSFFDRDLRKAR